MEAESSSCLGKLCQASSAEVFLNFSVLQCENPEPSEFKGGGLHAQRPTQNQTNDLPRSRC
jgi:hypothetical protein